MKEVFSMWENTRMIVLTALTAAVYAAVLIPLKPIPIIPGFTEIRPANVFPVVCSLLFGPAAAWGAAFGNLIGDFFGTLGLGSIFGFIGNFLFGYIPYRAFRCLTGNTASRLDSFSKLLFYLLVTLLASLICGVVIGWGVDLLGLVPFAFLGNIIVLNNFLVAAILGPLVLALLYKRVERWGLLYSEIMSTEERSSGKFSGLGLLLLSLGGISALIIGNYVSLGILDKVPGQLSLSLSLWPSILLIIVGSLLI
ncbi:MAG: QueT transporter family protein [Candidatus Edwardsbacteria bacterium]